MYQSIRSEKHYVHNPEGYVVITIPHCYRTRSKGSGMSNRKTSHWNIFSHFKFIQKRPQVVLLNCCRGVPLVLRGVAEIVLNVAVVADVAEGLGVQKLHERKFGSMLLEIESGRCQLYELRCKTLSGCYLLGYPLACFFLPGSPGLRLPKTLAVRRN